MNDLEKSLQNQDLRHLQIVAGFWGAALEASDPRNALKELVPHMLDPVKVEQVTASLSVEARRALDDLLSSEGRLPWSLFTRRHGELREMGPGRRDREQPHLHPVSPTEVLWYRGLVARAFLDTADGPVEHAYIPTDLVERLPAPQVPASQPGRPAPSNEHSVELPATDRVLDHACTLLAALRLGFSAEQLDSLSAAWRPFQAVTPYPLSVRALRSLLETADLLESNDIPNPETTRYFLELPRANALAHLARAWMHSKNFNELHLMPELVVEGEPQNDPLKTRYAVLDLLFGVPGDGWWNLNSFVEAVRQKQPDFQRPAGDYDSWYIRHRQTGEYLRGFDHWNDVDGALVRFIILGPLRWLGIAEVASPAADAAPSAFRFSRWSKALFSGAPPDGLEAEDDQFLISSDARVRVPRLVPRAARYQLARFSEWENESQEAYLYRLTPSSLERAREQGLRVIHLQTLLHRYALAVPPTLESALKRWQEAGSEVRLDRLTVLRLKTPDLLQAVRASHAARFLGEPLGQTAIIVNPGAADKVLAILAEMGYLGESTLQGE
jgi:hypothetical protein